jgi:hypothetical protein
VKKEENFGRRREIRVGGDFLRSPHVCGKVCVGNEGKVCGNVSGRVWSSVRKESAVEENVWTGMWAGTSNGSIHVRRRGRVKVGGRALGVEVNTNGDLDQSACEIFMCLVAEGKYLWAGTSNGSIHV